MRLRFCHLDRSETNGGPGKRFLLGGKRWRFSVYLLYYVVSTVFLFTLHKQLSTQPFIKRWLPNALNQPAQGAPPISRVAPVTNLASGNAEKDNRVCHILGLPDAQGHIAVFQELL